MLRRHGLFLLGCLAAAAVLAGAYSNHFDNGFHFDDSHVIVDNLYLRSLSDIPRFFTDARTFSTRPESVLYRPLLTLTYALDYRLGGGLVPRAFHATQFALLVGLGLLLVLLYRRLLDAVQAHAFHRWAALLGATFFCVHTANTQTVNYLSSRSDLLSTTGIVASVLLYVAWPRGRATLLYLVPLLVAGFAKPLAVMGGPLLFAYRALLEQREAGGWARLRSALVATLPALGASVALYIFLARMTPPSVLYSDVDRWSYLATQPAAWLHYFKLFVLPTGLTADTDWTFVQSLGDTRLLRGGLFVAALIAAFVVLARRARLRVAAFGLAWFALALVPTSMMPLSEAYNEHRVFFPYVGSTLAAVALAAAACARRPALRRTLALAAIAIIGAHAVGTHARNRVWRDELSLWKDVSEKSPRNGRGLMNYGVALLGRGQRRQALEQFERAEAIVPGYGILQVNLAIAKDAVGEPGVEAHFRRALELDPGYARGRYAYAQWLVGQGRCGEGLSQLEVSLAASPGDLQARRLMARLLAARGDEAQLARFVRQTLEIAPADSSAELLAPPREPADAYSALARKHGAAGDWLAAAGAARHAAAAAPDSAAAWNDLGWARLQLGFRREAVECFERAIVLDPGSAKARANLERAQSPDAASR